MAAVPTGTPQNLFFGGYDATPAPYNATIAADATAAYVAGSFWAGDGATVDFILLDGEPPDQLLVLPQDGDASCVFLAVWYNPPTGTQVFEIAFTATPGDGPAAQLVCTKGGNTTSWRDADVASDVDTAAPGFTLTTAADDLVLKYDQNYDSTFPALTSGYINLLVWAAGEAYYDEYGARLSAIAASGSTLGLSSENPFYSALAAVSIPAAEGTATYSYTATGGLALGGAATAAKVKAAAAAGGLTLGGAATRSKVHAIAAAGGLTLGGASIFSKGFSRIAVGGLQLGGSASVNRIRVAAAAGGLNLSGTADYSSTGSQQYSYTASGGLTLSGLSLVVKKASRTASGGLQLGGAAPAAYHESVRIVVSSGGIQLGGSADFQGLLAGGGSMQDLVRDARRRGRATTTWGRG